MRKLVSLVLAAGIASTACAQPAPSPQPRTGTPRLIIAISVDQFSADLFDTYRSQFTGGLARIASGTVFRNGYQAHAATETCPGHSTILTGSSPAHTGIIANNWIDQSVVRPNKSIYCAEDERLAPPNPAAAAGTAGSYVPSPAHLRVQTLGDILKARSPQSLNVAVAGKDRAAIMMGGRNVDQRWFWNGTQFVTDRPSPVPATIRQANAAIAATIASPRPGLTPPPFCAARAAPIALTATMTVGNGNFARAAGDARGFRVSPEMDGATLAIAASLIQELRLGADNAPDILSVGLSATDYVGHAYGPGGQEMCLQMLSLDRDLGDFFRLLDSRGVDYAVMLTADHGSPDIPERLRARGNMQAARADANLSTAALGKAIGAKLQIAGPVLLGDFAGDVYFDRALTGAQRQQVEQLALNYYRNHPQVEAVFTSSQLRKVRMSSAAPDRWTIEQRVRASFDPQRSGDLYVALKQYVVPIPIPSTGYAATHGSVWDYDRRVPIIFWRPGTPGSTRNEAVSTTSILPTLEAMLRLNGVPKVDGPCLSSVPPVACPSR